MTQDAGTASHARAAVTLLPDLDSGAVAVSCLRLGPTQQRDPGP